MISDEGRLVFYKIVVDNIKKLEKEHRNIIVSQALIKEKFRLMMLEQFPQAKFIWLKADKDVMARRLTERGHFLSKRYADQLESFFEEPQIDHFVLNNNDGEQEIVNQMKHLIN